MAFEGLRLSLPIINHPMIKEKTNFKIKYVNVLEYFVHKYYDSDFSRSILDFYINLFDIKNSYVYDEKFIVKYVKTAASIKIKGLKFFTYRYILVADCLFIAGYYNEKNIYPMIVELKKIFKKRYHKKIDQLIESFNDSQYAKLDMTDDYILFWKANKEFTTKKELTVLVTANMSAGKSTLLNALVGKKINKTKNDACTAKIHYILNKPLEDNLNYEWDGFYNLNADNEALMNDAQENSSGNIGVGTYFKSKILSQRRMTLIDTPGVNSALHEEHAIITNAVIKEGNYDCIMYVLNAENIGTEDDIKHLKFVYENCKNKKIIFVINKLDRYRSNEDSVEKAIDNVLNDLKKIGFENPTLCPVSAFAALLAKKDLFGEILTEEEKDEYNLYIKKFNKEEYNLQKYYGYANEEQNNQNYKSEILLNKCGLIGLEQILVNI